MRTPAEAAGSIGGALAGNAQMVMPFRMWITVIAAAALIVFVCRSESLLDIAQALCLFLSLVPSGKGKKCWDEWEIYAMDSSRPSNFNRIPPFP